MRHLHGDLNGQKQRLCLSFASDLRQTHTPPIYRGVCVSVCRPFGLNL
jgi:hypothetical protein